MQLWPNTGQPYLKAVANLFLEFVFPDMAPIRSPQKNLMQELWDVCNLVFRDIGKFGYQEQHAKS